MDPKHKEELRRKRTFIVENIGDCEAVCDELMALDVFDETYLEKIKMKKPAPKEQTKEMLHLLSYRGPQAYPKFIEALKMTHNDHVVDKLLQPQQNEQLIEKEDAKVLSSKPPPPPSGEDKSPVQASNDQSNWPFIPETKRQKCDPDDAERLQNDDSVYKITVGKEHKGVVLKSKCLPDQLKSEQNDFDRWFCRLEDIFKDDSVKILQGANRLFNCSAGAYLEKFQELLNLRGESIRKAGYFVFFALTYGSACTEIYDNESKCAGMEEIKQRVLACEALKGKPKIFIILTLPDSGTECQMGDKTETDAGPDNSNTNEDDLFVLCVKHNSQYGPSMKCFGQESPESNLLWFIKAFQDVMNEHSHKLHFLELVEEVNKLLGNAVVNKETNDRAKVAEVIVCQKSTQKKLYFFPGVGCQQTKETGK